MTTFDHSLVIWRAYGWRNNPSAYVMSGHVRVSEPDMSAGLPGFLGGRQTGPQEGLASTPIVRDLEDVGLEGTPATATMPSHPHPLPSE